LARIYLGCALAARVKKAKIEENPKLSIAAMVRSAKDRFSNQALVTRVGASVPLASSSPDPHLQKASLP